MQWLLQCWNIICLFNFDTISVKTLLSISAPLHSHTWAVVVLFLIHNLTNGYSGQCKPHTCTDTRVRLRPAGCRAERIPAVSCVAATPTHSGNKTADHKLHYARPLSVSFRVCGCPCALLPFQTRASHSWIVAIETRVGLLNQRLYQHAHSQDNLSEEEVVGRWEC